METEAQNIDAYYEADAKRREELGALVRRVQTCLTGLDMDMESGDTDQLFETVTRSTFKILVLGEFNTGKSTFINALLGEEVLPSKATPATAIINRVKWGDTREARLHFREPGKDPVDIPIDELIEFVTIKEKEEEIKESPYSFAEIWWPLPLLKNKVELIDSPGLNESDVREEVTQNYLNQVDAVLFLMSATRFGPAKTELDTIELLKRAGHEELFFIVNKWDLLRRKRDKDAVTQRAVNELPKHTNRKDKPVYYVSAEDALVGRTEPGEAEAFAASGFSELEEALHHFLGTEKARIKAVRGVHGLRYIMQKAEQVIPEKIELLNTPHQELEERFDASKANFERVNNDKLEILNYVTRSRREIHSMTRTQVKEFFLNVIDKVPLWAEDFPIKAKMGNVKKQIEDAIEGLANHFGEELTKEFETWQEDTLNPFIEERLESLYRELERRATDFENRLSQIRFELTKSDFANLEVKNIGPKSSLERILAAAGGWAVGGLGAGAVGAVLGYEEMLKALIPNILALLGAMIVGLPVLPVILIVGLITGHKALGNVEKTIREKVTSEFQSKLREEGSNQAQHIADKMDERLSELEENLNKGMERQIGEIKEQMDAVLEDKVKGEAEVQNKLNQIENIREELRTIDYDVDNFLMKLVN